MSKTITGGLGYRKQFALKAILENRTNSRNFDNCFEMGDGDEVLKFIMQKATKLLPKPNWVQSPDNPKETFLTSKEDEKKFCEELKQARLVKALKSSGFWEPWLKTFNNLTINEVKKHVKNQINFPK